MNWQELELSSFQGNRSSFEGSTVVAVGSQDTDSELNIETPTQASKNFLDRFTDSVALAGLAFGISCIIVGGGVKKFVSGASEIGSDIAYSGLGLLGLAVVSKFVNYRYFAPKVSADGSA